MTIEIDVFTLAGLVAVLAAYPPIFRQIRDVITTTIAIVKVMMRYVELPASVQRVETELKEHLKDHGGTT
jgi:lipid A disaccharide synthetase